MSNSVHHRGPERRQVDRRNGRIYERRKKNLFKPFFFYTLEILLLLPVLGIAELTLDPFAWSPLSYAVAAVWVLYATKKLFRVLSRQGR